MIIYTMVPLTTPHLSQLTQMVTVKVFFYFNARVRTTVTKEMAAVDTTTAEAVVCGDGAYYPGSLDVEWSMLRNMTIVLDTSGVWDYYFKPVKSFHPLTMTPNDLGSCALQPFVELPNNDNNEGGGVVSGGSRGGGIFFVHRGRYICGLLRG